MNKATTNPAPIGKAKAIDPLAAQTEQQITETEVNELLDAPPIQDKVERLAKRLCAAAGHRTDAYYMGVERWQQFRDDAARFLVAYEFMKEMDDE